VFELDTNKEEEYITYNYKNLTNNKQDSYPSDEFIYFNTDKIEIDNELCIMDICIPVKPNCFSINLLNNPIPFSKIGTWICIEDNIISE
jgi:hypothetical protein